MNRRIRLFITALVASLFFSSSIHSQVLERSISIQSEDESIIHILAKIAKTEPVKFSFNSQILPREYKCSIHKNNVPLKVILNELFKDLHINYKEINGVVILKRKPIPPTHKKHKTQPRTKSNTKTNTQPYKGKDTRIKALVVDTITTVIIDTIIHYETITVYDTIYETVKETITIRDTIRPSKHFLAINYSPLFFGKDAIEAKEGQERYQTVEQNWHQKFPINTSIMYSYTMNKFYVSTGLQYFQLTETIDLHIPPVVESQIQINTKQSIEYINEEISRDSTPYTVLIPGGGEYTEVDTIIIKYQTKEIIVLKSDTTYHSDTTEEAYDLNLKRTNAYVTIPIAAGVKFNISDNIDITATIGMNLGFNISYEEFPTEVNYATNQLAPIIFSSYFESEVGYRLDTNFSLQFGLGYVRCFNSMYKPSFPVSTISQLYKSNLGIRYYF